MGGGAHYAKKQGPADPRLVHHNKNLYLNLIGLQLEDVDTLSFSEVIIFTSSAYVSDVGEEDGSRENSFSSILSFDCTSSITT